MTRHSSTRPSTTRSELVRAVRVLLAVTVFVFGMGFVSIDESALFDTERAAADDRTTTETRYRAGRPRQVLVTPAVTETRYREGPPFRNVLVTPAVTETRYREDPPFRNVLVTPAVTETRYREDPPFRNVLVTPAVTETRYREDPPFRNVLVTPAVTETRYREDPPFRNVLVTPAVTETRYRWVTRRISPCRQEYQGPPGHGSYVTVCSERVWTSASSIGRCDRVQCRR